MIITNKNDRLYNTRNFDNYPNIYTIKVDHLKIKTYTDYINDVLNKCYINYIIETLILSFVKKQDISDCKGGYQIIYGHFYNDNNLFLYQNTYNGKIVAHSVKKTQKDNLYFNTNNNLICGNSYKEINSQLIVLNNKLKTNNYSSNINNILTYIHYDDETLIFTDIWNSDYQTEILSITIDQPYIIENKSINLN